MSSNAIAILGTLFRPGIGSSIGSSIGTVIAGKNNNPLTVPALIAGVCAIGLTSGVARLSQPLSAVATSGTELMALDGDRHTLGYASNQSAIQPLRGYEAPDGLGLPTRREPSGTR